MTVEVLQQVRGLTFGTPMCSGRISVVPIYGDLPRPEYMSASESLGNGQLKVTEIKEGETVPELEATNASTEHILILEGEELLGAMQNRVLNSSVFLPPESVTRIPVSCTESGRWYRQSAELSDSDELPPFLMRARMMKRVSKSLRSNRQRNAGQREVWSEIGDLQSFFRITSGTSALKDTTLNHRESLDAVIGDLPVKEGQLGACVFIDGRIAGLDMVSKPDVFIQLWPKLIRSYALDSKRLTRKNTGRPAGPVKKVEGILSGLPDADWETFDAVGTGKELRLVDEEISGSALVYEDGVVHMSVINSRTRV